MAGLYFPQVKIPEMPAIKDYKLADTFYDRLRHHIEETQKQLKKDEQLAVYYNGRTVESIGVNNIGYHNPNLIIFYGRDSGGAECSILVHMEAVQLVLKIEKVEKKTKRRRIGFVNE